jgi:hypothetical protein
MVQARQWFTKIVNLYNTDGRDVIRIPSDFQATLAGPFGTLAVSGVDASRNGAGVQSHEALEVGTLVFLRITDVNLMCFATVRHCSRRGDGYLLGLKFREPLARERAEGDDWSRSRVAQTGKRIWDDPDV